MSHLAGITGQHNLANLLGTISKLSLVNNLWVAQSDAGPSTAAAAPEPPPLMPADIGTAAEFQELRDNILMIF